MMTLTVCPSTLAEEFDTYSPAARKKMFDDKAVSHYLRVPSPSTNSEEANEAIRNAKRISLSGAQPKYSVIVDEQESYLRYTQEGEQGTYILKPCPSSYHILNRNYCAANEHLTMQIAAQVYGIETAANGLCFFSNDEAAYLTRRFDVHDGRKYQQEDFAALMGYTKANGGSDYKYCNGSYEECAEVIQKYVKAARIDLLRFFRLIVFNFISLNDDAHLKNFSLIETETGSGKYHLSPAYDLLPVNVIMPEDKEQFALPMNGKKTNIRRKDFLVFADGCGITKSSAEKMIERLISMTSEFIKMCDDSFIPKDMKESLKELINARVSVLKQ